MNAQESGTVATHMTKTIIIVAPARAPVTMMTAKMTKKSNALKACCSMGVLDRAILVGLGLSPESANTVMLHSEELREEIRRLRLLTPNA